MGAFNLLVGASVSVMILLMICFAKNKWQKIALVVVALFGFGGSAYLSQHYLHPRYLSWKFTSDIKKQPLFALIAKTHPQEFNQFITKVKKSFEKKALQDVPIYSNELVNKIFNQHLQFAPDESIFVYLKATLDFYRYLYTQDPKAVVKLENPQSMLSLDLSHLWQDKTFQGFLNQVLETKKKVIEASIKTPVHPVGDEAPQLIEQVLGELVLKVGEPMVKLLFNNAQVDVSAQLIAPLIIEFYAGIVSTGQEKAGKIMRHIASLKVKSQK